MTLIGLLHSLLHMLLRLLMSFMSIWQKYYIVVHHHPSLPNSWFSGHIGNLKSAMVKALTPFHSCHFLITSVSSSTPIPAAACLCALPQGMQNMMKGGK